MSGVRIVHVGPDPASPGGMSAVIRALVTSQRAGRQRVDVIPTYRAPDAPDHDVDPVKRLAIFAGALFSLLRWCLGPGTRVVHVHAAVRGSFYRKAICVAVAKAARRPVILHVHSGAIDISDFHTRIGPARRSLLSLAFRAADQVVSVSSAGARAVERMFCVEDAVVVPNPAPQLAPLPPPPGAPLDDRVEVLYIGGFEDPSKGGAVLVEALDALLAACPQTTFKLAGPGRPPASLTVAANVAWLGWLDPAAKAEALRRCDVLLMPSLSEGLPVALLDAMASGRAIVASAVGGIPDVLTDELDGVLIPPGEPARIVEAVAALARDPGRRARLAAAARRRSRSLSSEEVTRRLEGLYRQVAARSGGRCSARLSRRGQRRGADPASVREINRR